MSCSGQAVDIFMSRGRQIAESFLSGFPGFQLETAWGSWSFWSQHGRSLQTPVLEESVCCIICFHVLATLPAAVIGGSSINILYKDTMEKLGIKQRHLQPSRTVFHGIVPGLSCSPIGKTQIDVLFGDKNHFR